MANALYETEVTTLDGQTKTLEDLQGKVALVVNTASQCGFTPQYEGLETLYKTYGERGLVVLGFPCNQFGQQEPGDSGEIQSFCQKNYGVSFPMHAKVDVNGPDAHPLFVMLRKSAPGVLGSTRIKWNFTKFLIARDGKVLKRYAPTTKPEAITKDIERALG